MTNRICAGEIETLLDGVGDDVRILSLDCFDTLIWRNVNLPVDVFQDLSARCETMEMRVTAEQRARRALVRQKRRNEVTIDDIYAHMFSHADAETIAACIDDELAAEARHAFAFRPVANLICEAKCRGLQVIIVSDTYLHEPQLRALIASAAGQDIADSIDRIFCSCEYGQNKASGLFAHVLARLGASPGHIVHLGDNPVADLEAPEKLGITGVHFQQFDAEASERLRLESVASTMLEQDTRRGTPALQPHRPQISLRDGDDPVFGLGHDVLGPILHGFVQWIADEADAFAERTGKAPKLLFLLRDGYLPAKAFSTAFPDRADQVAMVEISRFTANAASFTSDKAIEGYLIAEATNNRKDAYSQQRQAAYCRQLLFPPEETAKLAAIGKPDAFIREILKPKNVAKIIARAKRYGEGMFAHLRAQGVAEGDAVMLVDLGYNGSVQNVVEPVLRSGMGLDVAGRYLLLRETILTPFDKAGLIDLRHYDFGALDALCDSIAVVEQLCTVSQGSTVGYEKNGDPRRAQGDIKGEQSALRDAAQAACLAFVESAGSAWVKPPLSHDGDCMRRMAAATLARLLFLPLPGEVAILDGFVHDVNMGTGDMIKMIDTQASAKGMRRRGLFYTKNTTRMYLPGELQPHGMQALLPVFAARRFGLDLRQSDFQACGLDLSVMLANDCDHVKVPIQAFPTSDGYYQALIPVGTGNLSAAIMVGELCDWFQVEEISFHAVEGFMDRKIDDDSIPAHPVFEAVRPDASGLYQCTGENAFILVPPPAVASMEPLMLSFVFRPTVRRNAEAASLRKVA